MNEENTKKLYDKYPKIFADRDKPMTESCMYWGFECGDGWYDLLDLTCRKIQWHCDQKDWVPENIVIRKLKRLWNALVWNHIVYPLAHNILLDDNKGPRPAGYFKSTEWRLYQWIQSHFSLHEHHKESKIPRSQVVALQVKEKFGGLCFYVRGGDMTTMAYIDFAESMSYKICETCGSTKDVTASLGWVTIRCAECRAKAAKRRQEIDNTAGRLEEKK